MPAEQFREIIDVIKPGFFGYGFDGQIRVAQHFRAAGQTNLVQETRRRAGIDQPENPPEMSLRQVQFVGFRPEIPRILGTFPDGFGQTAQTADMRGMRNVRYFIFM